MPGRTTRYVQAEDGIDIASALSSNPQLASVKQNVDTNQMPVRGISLDDMDSDGSDEDDDEAYIAAQQAASNRKATHVKGTSIKKGGAFQSMGLDPQLMKCIARKGFSVPTPIQRKSIPLILENRDVVGMARTGSGKTAAFVIPMVQKLKAHSVKVGSRAIILSPSRELALQTLKSIKEFARGTDLKLVLLVGGDSLEDQFSQMTSNPDIIIATPGRFMHLLVEMSLDISTVRYVVFDEADRLFEMGFSSQLHEILYALPPSRQTLLFSATLPSSLVEFAKAGLKDPELVRLDADSKISPDLESAFLSVKSADKDGALLHLLQDVIKMPTEQVTTPKSATETGKKRKRTLAQHTARATPTEHSTIIFVATKHHVEYLAHLLRAAGYAVSYIYGSLDQTARKIQVESFRSGATSILIVTDVAARGIDIPLLANVINYNFPPQPKIFIHRVGRTARAGRKGWSYSLIQESDMPYLLDLQLFLGRRLMIGRDGSTNAQFATDIILGSIPRSQLETSCETADKLLADVELAALKSVAAKGEKLYARTRNTASHESVKRARIISANDEKNQPNLLYQGNDDSAVMERDDMLARISNFRPLETVFEIGKRGSGAGASEIMRRKKAKRKESEHDQNRPVAENPEDNSPKGTIVSSLENNMSIDDTVDGYGDDDSDFDDEVDISYHAANLENPEQKGNAWQDMENFMSYEPRSADVNEEKGYGVNSGSNFAGAAREVSMSLANDESRSYAEPSRMRWDKRTKKYVSRANDMDGSKGAKTIRGESGQKLAATFKSGRFDAWKHANRLDRMPRTGETENSRQSTARGPTRRYKHNADRTPKQPDKYRDDFHKKRKKLAEAKASNSSGTAHSGQQKQELRGVEDVRKQRQLQARRKEKNARPSRKKQKRA